LSESESLSTSESLSESESLSASESLSESESLSASESLSEQESPMDSDSDNEANQNDKDKASELPDTGDEATKNGLLAGLLGLGGLALFRRSRKKETDNN
ncbi:LPXTG cell wall anchor domain-containing protein, partial [Mammaliicoccus lentus]|uniref:LPXTG cell wall anchor domain-containing protein n=1 Tax=Mammaliicoccus lentus TaxID=42858 RepID=UPI0033950928